MPSIIQELKKYFSTIILINTDPHFSENYLIGKQFTDLNIILVKPNISKKKTVIDIVNKLDSENYIVKFL